MDAFHTGQDAGFSLALTTPQGEVAVSPWLVLGKESWPRFLCRYLLEDIDSSIDLDAQNRRLLARFGPTSAASVLCLAQSDLHGLLLRRQSTLDSTTYCTTQYVVLRTLCKDPPPWTSSSNS